MPTYGLIGRSLAHSLSKRYFTLKFEREKRKGYRYELFELDAITALPGLIRNTPDLRGLNVTIPYKEAVLPLLDALDPLAAAVGAVNTIAIHDGKLVGHNTDVIGFRETLLPLLPSLRDPGSSVRLRALVLGSGGASRAVGYVLRDLGIRFRIVSRSRDRGDLTWDLVEKTSVGVCKLIINCTPLGMHPNAGEAPPLPYEAIGPGHLMIDLIYEPAETLFLQRGRAQGASTVNGSKMVEAQAEAAWKIWQGPA